MTLAHERAISMFERAARRAQDPDVRSWASQMVPSLQSHLAMVKSGRPEAVAEKPHGMKPHQGIQGSPSPGQQQQQQQQKQQHQTVPSGQGAY